MICNKYSIKDTSSPKHFAWKSPHASCNGEKSADVLATHHFPFYWLLWVALVIAQSHQGDLVAPHGMPFTQIAQECSDRDVQVASKDT